ncbi:MAG: hypothetical protein IJ220_08990 [Clostridia bacterium]|nr:hypothetical protein [Clostridia bacterium]
MSRDNYNDFTGGVIDNWVNRSERELISLVAKDVGVSEQELERKIIEVKPKRYKRELTYWQVLGIANVIKTLNS